MIEFYKTFKNRASKKGVTWLNLRWFHETNHLYKRARMYDVGLAFRVDLKKSDTIQNGSANMGFMFHNARCVMFILSNEYMQDRYGNYERYETPEYDYYNELRARGGEIVRRFTILGIDLTRSIEPNELRDVEVLTEWGKYNELKPARKDMAKLLDRSLDLGRLPTTTESHLRLGGS